MTTSSNRALQSWASNLNLTPIKPGNGVPLPTEHWYQTHSPLYSALSKQPHLPPFTTDPNVFYAQLPSYTGHNAFQAQLPAYTGHNTFQVQQPVYTGHNAFQAPLPYTGPNVFPQPQLPLTGTGASAFQQRPLPPLIPIPSESSSDESESYQLHVIPSTPPRIRRPSKISRKLSAPCLKVNRKKSSTRIRRRASRASLIVPVIPGQSPGLVNFAGRPFDWRPDYKPPSRTRGLSRRLTQCIGNAIGKWQPDTLFHRFDSSLTRPCNTGPGGKCQYKLTPLLKYVAPGTHPVGYDIRLNPLDNDVQFLNLYRAANEMDYLQPATVPPQREMCLWHPRLPWYIYIRGDDEKGITIQDILCQIYEELSKRLRTQDYCNDVLDLRTREALYVAYSYRCGNDPQSLSEGYLRMDFLESDYLFLGLKKSRSGMWEIKTLEVQH